MAIKESEWEALSSSMMSVYIKKNREYGDSDLELMGKAMQDITEFEESVSGIEAALIFYITGKVARATSALGRGVSPSSDTILDLAIYSMMLACTRMQRVGMDDLLGNKYEEASHARDDV